MIAIIGSGALFQFMRTDPKDYDLVGTYDEIRNYAKSKKATCFYPINGGKSVKFVIDHFTYEAEIAYPGSSAEELLNLIENDNETMVRMGFLSPSLNILYMLKMSHRFLRNSPHFKKTMRDIHTMRDQGAIIEECHEEFYKRRMVVTYNYPHPVLEVSKSDFFTGDGVTYTFDHDVIHEAVKLSVEPAYKSFQPADCQVMVSKAMWDTLTHDVKINSCVEESMVLAIERSLVPFKDVMTPRDAFDMALMKCCTSIASGWWREFCWENYAEIRRCMPFDYWDNFQQRIMDGEIKPL